MALITAYAIENERFRNVVAQKEVSITDLSGKHSCYVTNTDRFLHEYEGALGVKTGYTNKAGHCFVGAVERDDVLLISAVLGSGWGKSGKEQKWKDTKELMDYGFANFHQYEIVKEGTVFGGVEISDSPVEKVEVVFADGYTALFSEEERGSLRLETDLPAKVDAPVRKGEKMGTASLFLGEVKLFETNLLAKEDIRTFTFSERLYRMAELWLSWRMF